MAEPSPEIILRAKQGDTEALTELIYSQQHYVYRIAMGVLKNPEDAADVTQEAFIRVFRSLTQYKGESRFTTWLYRLVVNLARDELRRRGRQVPVVTADDELDYDPFAAIADDSRWSNPEQALVVSETQQRVRDALEQLEEQYRLALTLYYFDDLKYQDIAEILDLPLNTIKSHIRRGKERLLHLIRMQEPEYPEHPTEKQVHETLPPGDPESGHLYIANRAIGTLAQLTTQPERRGTI